ncbi:MAG: SDR family NAD(P)-dependent oxidoreductase [Frankia sp.]
MTSALAGCVALVTGASSGIGEATALRLAAEGAAVALVARRADRLAGISAQLDSLGARSFAIVRDITADGAAQDVVGAVVEELGSLDILVNNAGVMLLGPVTGAPTGEWSRMLRLNVTAVLQVTHAALPHLLEAAHSGPRHVADVVTISSVAGRVVRAGSAVYSATKWGVNAFSEGLRQEVTEQFVRVAVVEPGATETELLTHVRRDVLRDRSPSTITRLAARDIADAVAYVVTRRRDVAVNEMLVRPTTQT